MLHVHLGSVPEVPLLLCCEVDIVTALTHWEFPDTESCKALNVLSAVPMDMTGSARVWCLVFCLEFLLAK